MKAIIYKEGKALLREVPVPVPGDGEALIAVEACGLCGTDLMKLSAQARRAVLGHELAGRIAKLGGPIAGFREGDRVIVAHHVPCRDCHYCRRGSESMCRQFKATNIDPGGFAEFTLVSKLHARHTMLKIPDGLDFAAASQTEPLACCLRNIKRLGVGEGDAVGVIGLGAIGLMTAQLLRHFKVAVFGLDLDGPRAKALGPWGQGFTDAQALEEALLKATAGRGADALILTAGAAEQTARRLSSLRDGGTLNIFAGFSPCAATLDLNSIYRRELRILSSYSPALVDLPQALELIASGTVSIAALQAGSYGLDEFAQAEQAVRARQVMKAIFLPRVRQRSHA